MIKTTLIIVGFCLWSLGLQAQSTEIQQLLLNVEKLSQFKQILRDMENGYQMLSNGYNTITDLSQGNFSLHKTFLDGLLQISPAVRKYAKIAAIINYQLRLVGEYKSAFNRFKRSGNFTAEELAYSARVYERLFDQSLANLDDLTTVITAGKLRMSDDERLKEIDRIYLEMQEKLTFLRHFNNDTAMLSLQRSREKNNIHNIQKSYGILP